jgi:hypothetical protein
MSKLSRRPNKDGQFLTLLNTELLGHWLAISLVSGLQTKDASLAEGNGRKCQPVQWRTSNNVMLRK